jgi:hypothetical protein
VRHPNPVIEPLWSFLSAGLESLISSQQVFIRFFVVDLV